MIRLPRLLDGNLQEKCRLTPLSLAVHLRLTPLSTAEMVLPAGGDWVSPLDMVELYDENGKKKSKRQIKKEEKKRLSQFHISSWEIIKNFRTYNEGEKAH